MTPSTPPATAIDDVVQGVEHEASKSGIRLFLWEKFVDSPAGKPVLLFVHGSSMASQPTFDLAVPGRPDSSVMDWFAKRGFVCWSVDMEGYGRSDKSRDIPCDIANGADDLAAATDYMRRAPDDIPYASTCSTPRRSRRYRVAAARSSAPLAMSQGMSRDLSERP